MFDYLNHVNAYRNAIEIFYSDKKMPMGYELEGVLKDTISAYKRRIYGLESKRRNVYA